MRARARAYLGPCSPAFTLGFQLHAPLSLVGLLFFWHARPCHHAGSLLLLHGCVPPPLAATVPQLLVSTTRAVAKIRWRSTSSSATKSCCSSRATSRKSSACSVSHQRELGAAVWRCSWQKVESSEHNLGPADLHATSAHGPPRDIRGHCMARRAWSGKRDLGCLAQARRCGTWERCLRTSRPQEYGTGWP